MGKLIAGFFGFMLGSALNLGFFGLTFGLWLGHQFDEALRKNLLIWTQFTQQQTQKNHLPKIFEHCFGLLGQIAKSDGHVSTKEIEVANAFMAQLNLTSESQRKAAQKAFNAGKKHSFPLQAVLMQIQIQCLMNPALKQKLIQAITAIKETDLPIHPNKANLIQQILQQLNVTFQHQRQHYTQQAYQPSPSQSDYTLLGVNHGVDKDTLKKAYRRLMHKHHPDRLTAQGASEAEIKGATAKTQDIKAAYERICLARGF